MEKGKLISLLRPSGCGKSATLRMVAKFIGPRGGAFSLDGEDTTKVPVHRRNFDLVFQSYALFPHLSVYNNVASGLRTGRMDKAMIDTKIKNIPEACGLTELAQRFLKQISGGQRQRVALTRAPVAEPKLLLLDEPLNNLDAKLRINIRVEVKRLQKKLGITTLFVIHDQKECFPISDKVAVMNNGMIEQYDSPENIYTRPTTGFVARFIGFKDFLELERGGDHEYRARDNSRFQMDMEWDEPGLAGTIRPDNIHLVGPEQQESALTGTVDVRTFSGKGYQYEVDTASGVLEVNMGTSHVFRGGEELRLYLPKDKLVLVGRQITNGLRTNL